MALVKSARLASPAYVETYTRMIVNKRVSMNAGDILDFSAATEIGPADVSDYDMSTVDCQVWVRDNEINSPTLNFDVPGGTVVTVALNTGTGDVKLINTHTGAVNIRIRITVRRKPAQLP